MFGNNNGRPSCKRWTGCR